MVRARRGVLGVAWSELLPFGACEVASGRVADQLVEVDVSIEPGDQVATLVDGSGGRLETG